MDIFRGAIVEPFGSFVSGLFTRWGDLDISIELPNGRYQRLQFIYTARVPIVKFESRSISCDVSIDNLSGQMKSKLLLWIKGIDEHFGDMVLLVKEWAKAQEINNSTSGSFNSYSLTLLVIFHFQTCVPAILPPLKDIYPGDIASDLKGVRADVVQRITETCTANIARWKSNRYRLVNQSSLSELLVSFFSKFSDIGRKARDPVICPYTGKWEALRSNSRWLLQPDAIFIEDPFERLENAARTVKASLMMKISEAFETSYRRVSSTYQTKASLLPGLARPSVLMRLPLELPAPRALGEGRDPCPDLGRGHAGPHRRPFDVNSGQFKLIWPSEHAKYEVDAFSIVACLPRQKFTMAACPQRQNFISTTYSSRDRQPH
ncbi:hypothetical protein EUGRSUZ_J01227 [Eucalyptus grandis]|uniref:Uncharacterized protein n=2 Tax=Eucalyptus grandis TaxID=71139 RepID=A0ACC3J4X8_EUCGR|nr:hypothetical protein EUGRSUZ_J01227 [Eucalyptus grandis]